MTTEPYTPDEAELIGCYAGAMEEQAGENYATAQADAERGIAKIKSETWDDAIDFVSRYYEDYLPGTWGRHANYSNPYREQEES